MAFTNDSGEYNWFKESPDGGEWSQGGPTHAVLELDKNKWEWVTIPFNNGLTILRKI